MMTRHRAETGCTAFAEHCQRRERRHHRHKIPIHGTCFCCRGVDNVAVTVHRTADSMALPADALVAGGVELTDLDVCALHLLIERSKGAASSRYAHLLDLPVAYDSTLFWSAAELEGLVRGRDSNTRPLPLAPWSYPG